MCSMFMFGSPDKGSVMSMLSSQLAVCWRLLTDSQYSLPESLVIELPICSRAHGRLTDKMVSQPPVQVEKGEAMWFLCG